MNTTKGIKFSQDLTLSNEAASNLTPSNEAAPNLSSSSEAALSQASKPAGARLSPNLTSSNEAALGHSNKLDGARLSPHFSLKELTKTSYEGVKNDPTPEAVGNLTRLSEWLEALRYRYNLRYCLQPGENYETSKNVKGITINSGYRSPQLNKRVGGAATSNHLTGCAVDIHCTSIEQALRYATILLDFADETRRNFDELFIEKRGVRYWLHFAVRPTERPADRPPKNGNYVNTNRRKISFLNA